MVICPGCQREIGTSRASCIYCGHDVAALRAIAGTDAGLSSQAGADGSWAVVLEAGGPDDGRDAAALAEALRLSAFEVGQILRRRVPYAIDCRTEDDARALARRLEDCGVRALTYAQHEVDSVPRARVVTSVTVLDAHAGLDRSPYRAGAGPRRMIVATRDGDRFEVTAAQLRLVAIGELRIRRRRVSLSLGSPSRAARELQRVLEQPLGEGQLTTDRRMLVDLYREADGEPVAVLRLASNTTTVEGLGVRNYERTAGLGRLLVWLQQAAPTVPVDQSHKFDSQRRGSRARRFSSHDAERWHRWSARAWVMTRARQRATAGPERSRESGR